MLNATLQMLLFDDGICMRLQTILVEGKDDDMIVMLCIKDEQVWCRVKSSRV